MKTIRGGVILVNEFKATLKHGIFPLQQPENMPDTDFH